jgi:hypothetical protein
MASLAIFGGRVGVFYPREGSEAGMTGFASICRNDMRGRFAHDAWKAAAMASHTSRRNAGVIHPPIGKGGQIGVAVFARQCSWKVGCMLGGNVGKTSVVAIGTFVLNAGMRKALDLEAGRAGVADIAGLGSWNVVVGFVSGSYPAAECMTSGTGLRRVLEDAVDVALFALQGGVNTSGHVSRFRMIEGSRAGNCCRLRERREQQECTSQQRSGHSAGLLCHLVQHVISPENLCFCFERSS